MDMIKKVSAEKLQIHNHSMTRDQFNIITVEGQAKNITSHTLTCAQVNAKFYDPEGKLIKTLSATTNDLEPGKTWNFIIMYHRELEGEKVDNYETEEGTSW